MSNYIFLLDDSGSMQSSLKARDVLLENIRGLGARDTVSLYRFSSNLEAAEFYKVKPSAVKDIHFDPRGNSTALYSSIAELLSQPVRGETLVLVVTDGGDNVGNYGGAARKAIATANEFLTFGILCPSRFVSSIQSALGIDNVTGWDDVERMRDETRVATVVFQTAVASGATQVKSGLFVKDVRGLPKVNDKFIRTEVQAHRPLGIRPYCLEVFKAYNLGSAYYELVKAETVQEHKELVLQNPNGDLFGGQITALRGKVALPVGTSVRIKPGSLNGYKIFVQSTSVNRKLVPGTTLLYRKGR